MSYLKRAGEDVILLNSVTVKEEKCNERTKVKFSFSEGETERCTNKARRAG